jgi:hypothetical protein
MTEEWIAERTLFAEHPGSARLMFTIRIGRPSQDPGVQRWGCSIYMDGLEPKPIRIRGMDSLQALELALTFAVKTMAHYEARGTVFYWKSEQRMQAMHLLSSL